MTCLCGKNKFLGIKAQHCYSGSEINRVEKREEIKSTKRTAKKGAKGVGLTIPSLVNVGEKTKTQHG